MRHFIGYFVRGNNLATQSFFANRVAIFRKLYSWGNCGLLASVTDDGEQ
jgi:hypothetical protein